MALCSIAVSKYREVRLLFGTISTMSDSREDTRYRAAVCVGRRLDDAGTFHCDRHVGFLGRYVDT